MSKVVCPACQSEHAVLKKQTNHYSLTMSDGFDVVEQMIVCSECGDESFASDDAKNAYVVALAKAKKELAGKLIQRLQDEGHSMVEIERAFQLPPKTLNRWKSANDSSAGALALLRSIVACPFLIEIAAEKFDQFQVERSIIDAAASLTTRNFTMGSDAPIVGSNIIAFPNILTLQTEVAG